MNQDPCGTHDPDALSGAPWYLVHPDELVLRLFLPMPEPLGLPHGYLFRVTDDLGPEAIEHIREVEESGLLLVSLGEDGAAIDFHEMFSSLDYQPWFAASSLVCSLQVFQTTADFLALSGLDVAVKAARHATGGVTSTDEDRDTAWPSALSRLNPVLAAEGLGSASVIEAVVPLRLLGALPPPWDTVLQPEANTHVPVSSPGVWPYVVAHEDTLVSDEVLDRVHAAVDVAIDSVRSMQRTYAAVAGDPITLLTRERSPLFVPYSLHPLAKPPVLWGSPDEDQRSGLVQVSASYPKLFRPAVLDTDQLERMTHAAAQLDNRQWRIFRDLRGMAASVLQREGDARMAGLLAGIAAEVLLDTVLLMLRWEAEWTPESSAQNWPAGLTDRVKTSHGQFLGGNWNFAQPGAVGEWHRYVAGLRNRIAHAGHEPTRAEAEKSLAALAALVTFVCDRLAADTTRVKFPRTAWTLMGREGLERRDVHTRRLREIAEEPDEPNWNQTFSRWSEAHQRLRRDQEGPARQGGEIRASALWVSHPCGKETWCLHDDETHLAAEAEPLAALPRWAVDRLTDIRARHQHSGPVSVAFTDESRLELRRTGAWVEEYHHVPLRGVMVHGEDLMTGHP